MRRYRDTALIVFLLFFCVAGCNSSPRHAGSGAEIGIASWYGKPFHGRKTASGERYNMNAMTAAHRTLPFGTVLRVTYLSTGRSVRVRINDRGPFVEGRIIDLSRGAARKLGSYKAGIVKVRLDVIRWGG